MKKTVLLVGLPSLGKYSLTDILLKSNAVELVNSPESIKIKITDAGDYNIIECVGLTEHSKDLDRVYNIAEDALEWRTESKNTRYYNFMPSKFNSETKAGATSVSDNESSGFDGLVIAVLLGYRFTIEDVKAMDLIKEIFGDNILKKCGIILFATVGQSGVEQSFEDYIQNMKGDLKKVVNEVEERYLMCDTFKDKKVQSHPNTDEAKTNQKTFPHKLSDIFKKIDTKNRFTINDFLNEAHSKFNKRLDKMICLLQEYSDSLVFHVKQVLKHQVDSYNEHFFNDLKMIMEKIKSVENINEIQSYKVVMKRIGKTFQGVKREFPNKKIKKYVLIVKIFEFVEEEFAPFLETKMKTKSCLCC